MARVEAGIPNFASGELSPRMRGRFDLPLYYAGCERMLNFLAETQGPAKYRTGFRFVRTTRRNKVAHMVPFQFNDEQAYLLEFTDGYMRIYKDEGVVLQTALNITAATQANPCVITSAGHGFSNGDEVFIDGVVGMTQLNGKFYIVAGVTANTFQLTDQDGNNVNSGAYTAYSSGGTVARVYEITTPYRETDDLFKLKFTQNADTMYIVHPYYEPRKLTRTAHTSWTLALFTRTADPFTAKKVITGITNANPAVVTSNAHGLANGDIVIIEEVGGMTQLNGRYFTIANVAANTFELQGENSTSHGAYTANGYASLRKKLPAAVGFYESRLGYAASVENPQNFWLSRAPTSAGVTRYDDFTTGSNPDDAVINSIASRESNKIRWLADTDRLLVAGTFGSVAKITGSPEDEAIAPDSIAVKRLSSVGVEDMAPIVRENSVLFVQRGKLTFISLEFDALADSFTAVDRNLVSDHITRGGIKQIAFQSGRPDVVWLVKDTGELLGLTFKSREDVSGWHRHKTENGDSYFEAIATMPRVNDFDQLWAVIKRTVNGATRRYVEFMEDEPAIPEFIDYFTAKENEATDKAKWLRDMFESQKAYVHVDSALSYDGLDAGRDASASVTPGATTGNAVTFTASASVFKSTDVGRQIWKKAINGVGEGRAEITGYTSPTQVTCKILATFNNTDAMAAGAWYLTTDSISGLDHLEGKTVKVVTDGSVHPDETVASGAITLDYQASVVHVGLGYIGFLKTMNLEAGGTTGPAQTKRKNIHKMGIRFLNTLGAEYGADLYKMQKIQFRATDQYTNRPPELFSGDKEVPYEDAWNADKHVIVMQRQPLPCTIELLVPYMNVGNAA